MSAASLQSAPAETTPGYALTPRVFEVADRRLELEDCATLTLRAADGATTPFAPGQFTMLYRHGIGEVAISISGDADAPEALIQTIRSVGAVTRALVDLQPGEKLGLRGPYGAPWPVESATGKHLLVVAGGLGIAPVRPILYWALARRDRMKSVTLVYGARSPNQILFASELRAWAESGAMRVLTTVDRAAAGWNGRVGVATDLLPDALQAPEETVAMVCGPEIMMRFIASGLARSGVSEDTIFLSMERNMKCGVGWCGHCQLGPHLICRDGPVFPYSAVRRPMSVREL